MRGPRLFSLLVWSIAVDIMAVARFFPTVASDVVDKFRAIERVVLDVG